MLIRYVIRSGASICVCKCRPQLPETVRAGDEKEILKGKTSMGSTVNKHIRVDENDWRRIENAARERGLSPTRLLISSTLEAIDVSGACTPS